MIKYTTLLMMLLISTTVQAAKLDGYQINLSLPINATSKPMHHLSISTPKEYNSIQPIEMFFGGDTSTLELIPKGDSPHNWSKIMTIHVEKGKSIQVDQSIMRFKNTFRKSTTNFKILEENIIQKKGYREGSLAMSYKYRGRYEVVYMQYYSGPLDMVGVQYATVIENDQDSKAVVNDLKCFVAQNIKLVSF
jgi:hypothetical protein